MPEKQQKLFCVILDEGSLEYMKDILKNMTVKGEDAPLHATALTCVFRNDPWPNVLQSIREQVTKELFPPQTPPSPPAPVQ